MQPHPARARNPAGPGGVFGQAIQFIPMFPVVITLEDASFLCTRIHHIGRTRRASGKLPDAAKLKATLDWIMRRRRNRSPVHPKIVTHLDGGAFTVTMDAGIDATGTTGSRLAAVTQDAID